MRDLYEIMKKAVVLLSGGVDSAVTLYIARKEYECQVLLFDYGQKASKELACARKIAEEAGCEYKEVGISLPWKGSALVDAGTEIPAYEASQVGEIPSTYVPSRNIIFLSFAASFAEAIGAEAVFIGAHQLDYSNYPDCRSEFFEGFQEALNKGTKRGAEGCGIKIVTPVINKTKKEIVETGAELGVPFEDTWSCYSGGDVPCGECESCMFRTKGFEEAGIKDPSRV